MLLKNFVFSKINNFKKHILFVFPHAGASAVYYFSWFKDLSDFCQICVFDQPGRGFNSNTLPFLNLDTLIEAISHDIIDLSKGSTFSFFGHSMGALIAHEVTLRLIQNNYNFPSWLGLSAVSAPDLIDWETHFNLPLSDNDLREKIFLLGGVLKEDLHLLEANSFLNHIRHDFKLLSEFIPHNYRKIPTNATLFCGDSDPMCSLDQLNAWSNHFVFPITSKIYSGGHFYFNNNKDKFFDDIKTEISKHA